MNIQKLDKSFKEDMRTLFKLCFNSMFDSKPFEQFIDSDELWQYIWGVKKDDALIASYIAYDGEAKFRKIPFKINYFDGVVSKPGERFKGTVREMMDNHVRIAEEKGVELLLLDPFKTSFYERLGYVTAVDMANYELPFELIRKPDFNGEFYQTDSGFVFESEKFEKKIKKVLELDWEKANYNPVKIPECYFKRMLQSKVHQTCIFEENGVPKGYILYTVEDRVLSIRRITFTDLKVIRTLNHFIYQFKDQVDKVEMIYMPNDLPIHLLCDTMRAGAKVVKKTKTPSRMMKIPDIEKVMYKIVKSMNRTFPEILITFKDELIEKNNKTFWLKNDKLITVDEIKEEQKVNHMRMSMESFIPIFTGYSSFTEKYLQGCISVNGGFSSEWNQFDIPEILRRMEFCFLPLQTYSTEFCY